MPDQNRSGSSVSPAVGNIAGAGSGATAVGSPRRDGRGRFCRHLRGGRSPIVPPMAARLAAAGPPRTISLPPPARLHPATADLVLALTREHRADVVELFPAQYDASDVHPLSSPAEGRHDRPSDATGHHTGGPAPSGRTPGRAITAPSAPATTSTIRSVAGRGLSASLRRDRPCNARDRGCGQSSALRMIGDVLLHRVVA